MNKESRRKVFGGHFGQISAIDLIDQTVLRSSRMPQTESQMELVHVTQEIGRCLEYRVHTDERLTGRITNKRKSLPQVLRLLVAKRVRYSFQQLSRFAAVQSQSDFSRVVSERGSEEKLSEAVSNLHSVCACLEQKLKVYAFIQIKMLASSRDYTFSQVSYIGREYVLLKVQALEAAVQRAFESLRRRTLQRFFEEVEKYSWQQAAKQKATKSIEKERNTQTLRKTSKSATIIGPTSSTTDGNCRQIIYVVNHERSSHRQKTEGCHPPSPTNKPPAFIRVPLYSQQVELNEIRLKHNKTEKYQKFNATTAHKQRRRMVDYDVQRTAEHGSGKCTECKYCGQQETLREIERVSQERRKSLTLIRTQFSKNRRLVHLH